MKLLLFFLAIMAGSPADDYIPAALTLTGAGSPEELSQDELERFHALAQHPLNINLCSRSRLLSCGLFSPYQVASICDCIASTGDILSAAELGTVNGFTPETAAALSHFVSFGSKAPPGSTRRRKTRHDGFVRSAVKDGAWSSAAKYHVSAGEYAEMYASAKDSPGKPFPDSRSFSAAAYGRKGWSLVAGGFNARFGQGLIAWSGFSMSGVPSPTAIRRSPTGLSPTGSFSPAFNGLALCYAPGRWNLCTALSGSTFLSNAGFTGRSFNLGARVLSSTEAIAASADWQAAFGHFTWFGEAAYSWKVDGAEIVSAPAAVTGVQWAPAYRVRSTLAARYYSPDYFCKHSGALRSGSKVCDEAGASLGVQYRNLGITLDAAMHPHKVRSARKGGRTAKLVTDYKSQWQVKGFTVEPSLRWTEKLTQGITDDLSEAEFRHEARACVNISHGALSAKLRGDAVATDGTGCLGYAEAGYSRQPENSRTSFSAFVCATIYDTPNWSTRIYCYERDLPGVFSVSACYGKGESFSALLTLRFRPRRQAGLSSWRHSFYLRASLSRAMHGTTLAEHCEMKLQYQMKL